MSHLPPKPDFDAKPRGDSYIPRRPDSYVDSYVAPRRGYEQRGRRRDYSPERRDYSPERHWGRRSRSRDYPREYRRDSRPDYRRSPPRPPRSRRSPRRSASPPRSRAPRSPEPRSRVVTGPSRTIPRWQGRPGPRLTTPDPYNKKNEESRVRSPSPEPPEDILVTPTEDDVKMQELDKPAAEPPSQPKNYRKSPPTGPRSHSKAVEVAPNSPLPSKPIREPTPPVVEETPAPAEPEPPAEPVIQLPVIPVYTPVTSLTPTLDAEFKEQQTHRARAAAEYAELSKATRRAVHELEIANVDSNAARLRREVADVQMEKARMGLLGIHYEGGFSGQQVSA